MKKGKIWRWRHRKILLKHQKSFVLCDSQKQLKIYSKNHLSKHDVAWKMEKRKHHDMMVKVKMDEGSKKKSREKWNEENSAEWKGEDFCSLSLKWRKKEREKRKIMKFKFQSSEKKPHTLDMVLWNFSRNENFKP